MINNRRRVLRVLAVGSCALAAPLSLRANGSELNLHEWNDTALGADATIQLYTDDQLKADQTLKVVESLLRHYERIFSLYDNQSLASKLNRNGFIDDAPEEFIELVKLAKSFHDTTDGAFDISVQPLWNLYQSHFSSMGDGELSSKIKPVLDNIGSEKILISNKNVSFDTNNMAVSFNGIAQGYITDKVSDYLKEQGFTNVLVDIGEYRAIGPQKNGAPWRIGVLNPFDTVSIFDVLELDGGAVATSGGYGNQFDGAGQYHHLFDPKTGLSSQLHASVTVKADDATTADALSTAFSNMSYSMIESVADQYQKIEVKIVTHEGDVKTITS